jgi:hypothetical protein
MPQPLIDHEHATLAPAFAADQKRADIGIEIAWPQLHQLTDSEANRNEQEHSSGESPCT